MLQINRRINEKNLDEILGPMVPPLGGFIWNVPISINSVMQYSIVWMITNFSTTIKLSEKKYRSTNFTVYCLENLDAKNSFSFEVGIHVLKFEGLRNR
jgi:hypothetical protein